MTKKQIAKEKTRRTKPLISFGYDVDLEEALSLTDEKVVRNWLKRIYAQGYFISKATGEVRKP